MKSHKKKQVVYASTIKAVRVSKVRWKTEKPLRFECKTYRVDVAELQEGNLSLLPIPIFQPDKSIAVTGAVLTPSLDEKPKNRLQIEVLVSDRLAALLKGEREAPNDAGRVDVLTRNYVIEVKTAANWKHGIGQALIYSFYYPDHKPMLYLFGDDLELYKPLAKQHCERLGVKYNDSMTLPC